MYSLRQPRSHVLSNGRFKSVLHRAVTNKLRTRVSMAMFYGPNMDTIIGPIEDLIDEEHPPRYRNYQFSEFIKEFYNQEGTRRMCDFVLQVVVLGIQLHLESVSISLEQVVTSFSSGGLIGSILFVGNIVPNFACSDRHRLKGKL
ncbi:Flavonol synthase/flavanone 3-hydroxylase, partial [Mucuna pruriens]